MIIAQCVHDLAVSHGLVASLFLAGLVVGFTHCAGMCSPFVLAQINGGATLKKPSSSLLLPYHLGRATTYVGLAVLTNSLINLVFVFSDTRSLIAAPLLTLAGVVFLMSAFPRLGALFPWAARLSVGIPFRFLQRSINRLSSDTNAVGRYMLGIILGFMPCGLVVSALLAAATATDVFQAALAMAAFAAGTVPALVMVSLGGAVLKQKYPLAAARISQGAMVISSLWLFILAGLMVL